jgi:hypothetical protein
VQFAIAIGDNSTEDHNGTTGTVQLALETIPSSGNYVQPDPDREPQINGDFSDWNDIEGAEIPLLPAAGEDNGITSVFVKAANTDYYLYIYATWEDSTEGNTAKSWTYSSGDTCWSRDDDEEDWIAFMFPILEPEEWENEGCLMTCHDQSQHITDGPNEVFDIWEWRAARSSQVGFADDAFLDDVSLTADLTGDSPFLENFETQGTQCVDGRPKWMPVEDPGESAVTFLLEDAKFYDGSYLWSDGDRMAGYVLRNPSIGRADIIAAAVYDSVSNTWELEMRKLMVTGDLYDREFVQ